MDEIILNEPIDEMPEVAVWNLVFMDHPREHWWDWLTEPGFRHVCAFGHANRRWIVYDAADVRSRIMVLNEVQFDLWLAQRWSRITDILQVPVGADAGMRGRVGLWCVTAVKHLAGIQSSALRPKALHRDLTRRGCERLWHGDESAKGAGKSGGRGGAQAG